MQFVGAFGKLVHAGIPFGTNKSLVMAGWQHAIYMSVC